MLLLFNVAGLPRRSRFAITVDNIMKYFSAARFRGIYFFNIAKFVLLFLSRLLLYCEPNHTHTRTHTQTQINI